MAARRMDVGLSEQEDRPRALKRSAPMAWIDDIERATLDNETFRTVLFTGEHLQLTVMHIEPGGEIGEEVHEGNDQFLRIEAGRARVELGDEVHEVEDDWAVIVPSGVRHNVINTGSEPLKVYSLYAPPQHPDGTVHRTKADADAAEAAEH